MKGPFFLLIINVLLGGVLSSCSLKEVAENGFGAKTKIDPMASSESLASRYGDGRYTTISIKIPLTESSVGYFDLEEVVGQKSERVKHKGSIGKMIDELKYKFKLMSYNMAVSNGKANSIRYSSVFDFPQIDRKFVKQAKVKKIFFTAEDCRSDEQDCDGLHHRGSNFNLVDTFLVNLSHPSEVRGSEPTVTTLKKEEYNRYKGQAFRQNHEKQVQLLARPGKVSSSSPINIVRFENNIPFIDANDISYDQERHVLIIDVKEDQKLIRKFLLSTKFDAYVEQVVLRNRYLRLVSKVMSKVTRKEEKKGVEVFLKKDRDPERVIELISEHQTVLSKKMFILRLEGEPILAKKFLKHKRFDHLIEDMTLIGRSLFIELKHKEQERKLLEIMKRHIYELEDSVEIYKVDKCSNINCLDLNGADLNLVPFLAKGSKIMLETVLSVRSLSANDFKYSGFVELEIVLDLPI